MQDLYLWVLQVRGEVLHLVDAPVLWAMSQTGEGMSMGLMIESCIDCNSGVIPMFGMTWCGECDVYLHPHEVVKRYV